MALSAATGAAASWMSRCAASRSIEARSAAWAKVVTSEEATEAPILPGEAAAPRVWPIRLAFYRASSRAPEPDVEIGMLVEANGVMRRMTLEYGNFSIDGRLGSLELLPDTGC